MAAKLSAFLQRSTERLRMTPAEHRARLGLSVAAMAQLVGVTRAGWYKIERTSVTSPPLARLLAYIERYGVGLAKEMMAAEAEEE